MGPETSYCLTATHRDTPMEYIIAVSLRSRVDLDKVGATASMVCAIHCFITGVAFGLLPIIGLGFFNSLWFDLLFIGLALSVGLFAVPMGFRRHRSFIPGMVFVAGLTCIGFGHFVFGHETVLGTVLSVLGGLSLVTFHVLNSRMAGVCRH